VGAGASPGRAGGALGAAARFGGSLTLARRERRLYGLRWRLDRDQKGSGTVVGGRERHRGMDG
jgi:hypothetical protein